MTNIFMMQVRDAVKFSFKNISKYLKYRKSIKKFKKKIMEGSPSFGVLWNFAEFIQYAELIYFYDNNKNAIVYSSTDYTPTQSGFKINGDKFIIVVKLFSNSKRVGIDIERKYGNKLKTNYTFENDQFIEEPDEYDELLLDNIIEEINRIMIWLLKRCITEKLKVDYAHYNLI